MLYITADCISMNVWLQCFISPLIASVLTSGCSASHYHRFKNIRCHPEGWRGHWQRGVKIGISWATEAISITDGNGRIPISLRRWEFREVVTSLHSVAVSAFLAVARVKRRFNLSSDLLNIHGVSSTAENTFFLLYSKLNAWLRHGNARYISSMPG